MEKITSYLLTTDFNKQARVMRKLQSKYPLISASRLLTLVELVK